MKSDPEVLRTNLLLAREAVSAVKTWRKHHPKSRPQVNNPYQFCKTGWEANGFEGYFGDIPNALRRFVPNLTGWYQSGVSRRQMIDLFSAAISSPPVDLELVS